MDCGVLGFCNDSTKINRDVCVQARCQDQSHFT